MQDLIEYLSQEQLVNIIILLEDDKKLEAVRYITENTPLDEAQALQVIDEIVREHDVVMKHESTGPRFSDDAGDIDLVTPPLEIPTHPSLSTSTEAYANILCIIPKLKYMQSKLNNKSLLSNMTDLEIHIKYF